jgi:CheY-like chemotaxis protein
VDRTPTGDLSISWRESGGPPVRKPTRRGFGTTIIERSIPFELKGEADMRFKLTGLEADFVIPKRFFEQSAVSKDDSAKSASSAANDDDRGPAGTRTNGHGAGLPRHVLVVEDSMIIALDTEENLKRLGVKSVHVESSVFGALSAIEQRRPDFAIVDFNLGSESSAPVARELSKRRIPFVLATGYAEVGEKLAEFGASALIRKPYGRDEIEAILTAQFS